MTARGGLAFRRFAALMLLPLGLAALACRARGDADPDRILADLGDSRWQIRASAAEELGARGIERSIPRLGAALTDVSSAVRAAAASSLGRLRGVSELPRLRSCIREDGDPQVVVQALYALGAIEEGDPPPHDDVEMLFDKLSDDNRRVRGAAKRVLLALIDRRELAAAVRAELQSSSVPERIHAATAATLLEAPELGDWARRMLADPEPELRRIAYAEIALHPGRDGSAVLVGGLADASPDVRKEAAKGLQENGDRTAAGALEALVGSDPSPAVRQSAADALASIRGIPGKALPALWHFERIDDRLTIEADGDCVLTRSFSIEVERSVDVLRRLRIVIPLDFPLVDGVTDAAGNPLEFELRWRRDLREIDFEVAPIAAGEAATFRMTARSRRPLYAGRDKELLVAYAPGAVQAVVRALHVEVATPEGEVASLDRLDLAPDEFAKIEVRVATPSKAVTPGRALPADSSPGRELAVTAVVVGTILALLAGAIVWLRRTMGERADRAVLVIVLTGGALMLLSPILVEDNLAYYAFARSAVLDGDLDRGNEFIEMNQTNAYTPDNRGPLDPLLASIVRAPVVAAAHAFVLAANTLAPRYPANGFSFPYVYLVAVADFLMVLLGCLACFSLVERRVGRRYGLFAVIAVVAGTNLLLFAYAWAGSSFQPSFLLFAVFLNHWDKTREARSGLDWLGGGVLLGLLGMTRILNLSFALLPLLDWMHGLVQRLRGKRAPELARHVRDGGLLTAGMILGYAPQLLVQRAVDDVWLVDAYGVGSGRFSGLRANLGKLFLSPDGLVSAMPLLALALVGLVLLVRYDRWLGILLSATLALQLLAIGSYEVYWGMFEFGTPYLAPASPIFCLAMGCWMRAARSSSSSWRRLLPALLWGVTALCAWRNGWCMLRQLTAKMLGEWQSEMSITELLRTVFLLDRKLDVDVLRYSSGFAWLPRELLGALRAGDPGQLVAALLGACVVIAPVLLVAWWAWRLRGPRQARRRLRLRFAVPVLALLWAGLLGWLAVLGARTNVDYGYEIQEQDYDRDLEIERLEPGASFTWRFYGPYPASRVGLITMLDGAEDAPAGQPVASVRVVAGGAPAEFELRAGVDTADFEIERPESLGTRAHAAPLTRACFSWRVRDDSIHYYTARAYCSDFDIPAPASTTEVTVTSRLAHGAVAVLLASARESKIPRDPSRKRWLAERW